MPAKSKSQFDYMGHICGGEGKPGDISKEQACEYIKGQKRSNLPKKVKKANNGRS